MTRISIAAQWKTVLLEMSNTVIGAPVALELLKCGWCNEGARCSVLFILIKVNLSGHIWPMHYRLEGCFGAAPPHMVVLGTFS